MAAGLDRNDLRDTAMMAISRIAVVIGHSDLRERRHFRFVLSRLSDEARRDSLQPLDLRFGERSGRSSCRPVRRPCTGSSRAVSLPIVLNTGLSTKSRAAALSRLPPRFDSSPVRMA
jgi:hypothetical protein